LSYIAIFNKICFIIKVHSLNLKLKGIISHTRGLQLKDENTKQYIKMFMMKHCLYMYTNLRSWHYSTWILTNHVHRFQLFHKKNQTKPPEHSFTSQSIVQSINLMYFFFSQWYTIQEHVWCTSTDHKLTVACHTHPTDILSYSSLAHPCSFCIPHPSA